MKSSLWLGPAFPLRLIPAVIGLVVVEVVGVVWGVLASLNRDHWKGTLRFFKDIAL